jgi:hypothetical protein
MSASVTKFLPLPGERAGVRASVNPIESLGLEWLRLKAELKTIIETGRMPVLL